MKTTLGIAFVVLSTACGSSGGTSATSGAASGASSGTAATTNASAASSSGTSGHSSTSSGSSSTTTASSGTATGTNASSSSGASSGAGASSTTASASATGATSGAATSTSSGAASSSSSGGITITFTTIGVHPAAVAALNQAGVQPPNLYAGGPADAGYVLLVQGLGLNLANSPPIQFNTLGVFPIVDGGVPSLFVSDSDLSNKATLGVLAGINPVLPDGGAFSPVGSLPQLGCAAVEGTGGLSAALAAASSSGLLDYYFPSGSQVGGVASPPSSDVPNAAAFAVPMSYASLLNCAGNAAKTTFDSDQGVALVYVTDGGPAIGNPVAGATFSLQNSTNNPSPVYYAGNYSMTGTLATDATGVGTFVNIQFALPPSVSTNDPANDTFFQPGIGTSPNSFFNAFVYIQ